MSSKPLYQKLSWEDQESVSALITEFMLAENSEQFSRAMAQVNRRLAFRYWGVALCRMQSDHGATSFYLSLDNFPGDFMQHYQSQRAEFFDVVALRHFSKEHFGQLQLWSQTFEEVEQNAASMDPALYQMHRNWREFTKEWGVTHQGYSMGQRSYVEEEGAWYGSMICYSDGVEESPRSEAFIASLVQAQHLALMRILRPSLL